MTETTGASVPTEEADDLTLAGRIASGDKAAFALLMRRYNRRLYRLARATLRDQTEAEDALQESYLAAYRSMAKFRGDAALSTWLSRLVLNECRMRLRRSTRRQNVIPLVSSGSCDETAVADEGDLPDCALDRAQMCAVLERKVDELPESFRSVFMLRSVEELSVEETAQCLDIPVATVRSRHFRARSLLRESVGREVDIAESSLYQFGGEDCNRTVARVLERVQMPP